ncbi:hypothetical protein CONPUDRAFT_147107 [Coniophora puteana RWD-64-598 SS2]|uniref:Uncharacterized protein n=1 Tax=Coniophora puteana (strain RWD-64-598) TaxID=741705 RepID=A0A5M3M9W6_CONPW|nr:uncharacterized protein CONPUDRAFT_147107 [Coniophora puteana RWD-64-598 SS2]EIW75435.1 hypothetical protein CONPUDRAFT_147107 [Coniophora puteana RWD-64-598 SS2]
MAEDTETSVDVEGPSASTTLKPDSTPVVQSTKNQSPPTDSTTVPKSSASLARVYSQSPLSAINSVPSTTQQTPRIPPPTSGGWRANKSHQHRPPSSLAVNKSHNTINDGAVVGAVIGAAALVFITVGSYVLLKRRYHHHLQAINSPEHQTQCTENETTLASDSKLGIFLPREQDGYGFSILPKLPFRSKWLGSPSTSTLTSSANGSPPEYASSQCVDTTHTSLLGTSSGHPGAVDSRDLKN